MRFPKEFNIFIFIAVSLLLMFTRSFPFLEKIRTSDPFHGIDYDVFYHQNKAMLNGKSVMDVRGTYFGWNLLPYSPPTHLNFTLFFYSENFQTSLSRWSYFNIFIYHGLNVLLIWLLKLRLKEGIFFLILSCYLLPYEINLLVGQLGILVFLGLKPELLYNRYLPYVLIFGTLGFFFLYIKFFKHSNTHSNLESQFFISSILLITTNLAAPLNLAYHMVYLNLVFLVLFKVALKSRSVYISGLLGLACFYFIVHFSIFSLDSYYIGKTFIGILSTSNWVMGMLILLCLCYYFLIFRKVKII
ncbi:MAG: hypothetical protein N3A69_01260 [Leptospiraceae bacterium]|nr:hypothetical protein [Leptospiraceae bacterium]